MDHQGSPKMDYMKALKNSQKQAKPERNDVLKEGRNAGSELHRDLAFPLWELLTSCGILGEIELNQKSS